MDDGCERFALTMFVVLMIVCAIWFVLTTPRPDYMPDYGSDPRDIPYQMKD